MVTRNLLGLVLVTLFIGSIPASLRAQDDETGRVIWRYDHAGINANRSIRVVLSPGEKFTIEIQNTDPSQFDYHMSGVIAQPPPSRDLRALPSTRTLTDYYDPTYGAYLISIERKPGESGKIELDEQDILLNNVILIINVETLSWEIEFAGSFTISDLTNPVYATQTRSINGSDQQFVLRETDKEDVARLGIAAFIHIFHGKLPMLAWTFGLGIQSDNKVSYYLGPTFRFNDKAAITAGAIWASIPTLPAGTIVDQPAPDANVLNNLGTKIERGWFIGFSYTFINVKDTLQKPFKLPENKS